MTDNKMAVLWAAEASGCSPKSKTSGMQCDAALHFEGFICYFSLQESNDKGEAEGGRERGRESMQICF